jgi:hypothetical protein
VLPSAMAASGEVERREDLGRRWYVMSLAAEIFLADTM